MTQKLILRAILSSVAIATSAQAAVTLSLLADTANSDSGAFGGSLAATLNDGFAYDPDSPTSSLPDQVFDGGDGFHADKNSGTHTLSYTLAGGALTTDSTNSNMLFDFYGRNSNLGRDNNYTISLYNGDYTVGNLISQQTGQGVANVSPYHNRTTLAVGEAVTFDRIQITSLAGGGDLQYFTVMEVRAATEPGVAAPEPSSTALLGLGGLALIIRRRR